MEKSFDLKQYKISAMIHFGPYSLLGGRWQSKNIPWLAEWIKHTAQIPDSEYRQIAKDFQPQKLQADKLVAWLRELGFQSLCLTAKHHDGYALYPSAYGDFNSERDLVGEFARACRREGLAFSLYYSQAQDWSDPNAYMAYRELEPADFSQYFYHKCLPQVEELLTRYGPLLSIWFDTPDRMPRAYAEELRSLVKRIQPSCLISGRIGFGLGDYLSCADNALPFSAWDEAWEVPVTCSESWGYKHDQEGLKTGPEILTSFLKTLSRGGHFLLNLGPDSQGQIRASEQDLFEYLGQYLKANAPAIYPTCPLDGQLYELTAGYMTHSPDNCEVHLHVNKPEEICNPSYNLLGFSNKLIGVRFQALPGQADPQVLDPKEFTSRFNLEGEPCWTWQIPENYRASSRPYSISLTYLPDQSLLASQGSGLLTYRPTTYKS